MFTFSLGGFGFDEDGMELAIGVISSSTFNDNPKCLFGIALSRQFKLSIDLFWIPVL